MNREILQIAEQLKEAYEGEPWFGKSALQLFKEIDEELVNEKPAGQHSMLELLWHMITWKEFTINRIRKDESKTLHDFESIDWRELDHTDKTLWKKGLKELHRVHNELAEVMQQQQDSLLIEIVPERTYSYRKLLNGIVQHDIYHLGQIAYVNKLLKG
jgi:uncharacterized damage-inducible protein DinB